MEVRGEGGLSRLIPAKVRSRGKGREKKKIWLYLAEKALGVRGKQKINSSIV